MGIIGWVSIAAGAALAVFGLAAVRSARLRAGAEEPGPGLGAVSLCVIGLGALVAAYHLIAYPLPASWFPLKVPLHRAWILGVGLGSAIGGTLWADALEARRGRGEG